MAVGDVPLTPIIDTVTGSVTEIGRIFLRTLAAAVNGLAPIDATYWTSKAEAILSAEVNLGALASGYLKLATAVGIATPTTVATIPQADVTGLTAALAGKATLPIAQVDVTNLVGDLASKAPLASPALTGTPTAPTAPAATNTTQLATTAMVQAAIAPLAPLASPALTGVPTVPTAAPGTNTPQAASTAFVLANAAAAPNPTRATVLNSGPQSIPHATYTILTFDTEAIDVGNVHSTIATTGRLTIPAGQGGTYRLSCVTQFPNNTAGQRLLVLQVNGATVLEPYVYAAASALAPQTLSVSRTVVLNAGDYVQALVYQDSGAPLNAGAASAGQSMFECWRLA